MENVSSHRKWMEKALDLAEIAANQGEVPVGAIIVKDGQVISQAHNTRESSQNPLEHAEITAIQGASKKLKSWRLINCTLYVTLEPCCMCAGAIVNSRIERVVYAVKDPKAGAIGSVYEICLDGKLNHSPEVISGVLASESSRLLRSFFANLREGNSQKEN